MSGLLGRLIDSETPQQREDDKSDADADRGDEQFYETPDLDQSREVYNEKIVNNEKIVIVFISWFF